MRGWGSWDNMNSGTSGAETGVFRSRICYLCLRIAAKAVYPDPFENSKTIPPMHHLLRRLPLVLAFLAAIAPAALRAQADVEPRTRVRILPTVGDSLIGGTVATLNSASLLIAPRPDAEFARVPVATMERLQASRGGRVSTTAGGVIGAVVGAGAGLGAALLLLTQDCEYVCGATQVGSAVIGGAVGLVVGVLLSSSSPHEPER
jgi:hypothetical protein